MNDKRDLGLLVLRVGMGVMFIYHGVPKLFGGPEKWAALGSATKAIGIDFAPSVFGLAAALSETLGGLLVAVGFAFRPALGFLVATMLVAAAFHLDRGDGFAKATHAIECAIVFASMLLMGPGRYGLAIKR